MYVIADTNNPTTYYFSYWGKHGLPVYVPEIERARLYETKKEASFDKQKSDKILKVADK